MIYIPNKKYAYIEYLSIHQDKLSLQNYSFEGSSFGSLSEISIPGVLVNIVYCFGFPNEQETMVSLSCHCSTIYFYLSEGFIIENWQELNKLPGKKYLLKWVHALIIFIRIKIMTFVHASDQFYFNEIYWFCLPYISKYSNSTIQLHMIHVK